MARTTNGLCRDNRKEWNSWNAMRHRCHNPKNPFYVEYGARGITVCHSWRFSFATFLDDMGERPSIGHSLDRIDGTKGYSPDNCRWATRSEQNINRKVGKRGPRKNIMLTFNGQTKSLTQWADHLEITRTALCHRIYRYGWTLEEALGGVPRTAQRGQPRKHYITHNGVTLHVSEWAKIAGITHETLAYRYFRAGWSFDACMNTPVQSKTRRT